MENKRHISNTRHICINTGLKDISSYDQDLIRGVLQFSQSEGTWEFAMQPSGHPLLDEKETWMWKGNGIITAVGCRDFLDQLVKRAIPTVSVCLKLAKSPTPRVTSDDTLVGIMGATHLLELPLPSFAFVRLTDAAYAIEREQGFKSTVQSAGYQCRTYIATSSNSSPLQEAQLRQFLENLPKPIGIMVDQDTTAMNLIRICKSMGFRIPCDIAIMGVNNDNTLCEMTRPTLTSIELNNELIGFEAAALLEQMMTGAECTGTDLRIPPLRVVERASTNLQYPGDEALSNALGYIHAQAHKFIKVNDVVRVSRVSRRTLEKRFRDKLGRTIHNEIQHTKLKHAQTLLQNTDWSQRHIAQESGFIETSRLHEAFKRSFGQTPDAYRKNLFKKKI